MVPHLESWRNVEGGIHPAVAVQNTLVHTTISLQNTDKSNVSNSKYISFYSIPYQVTLDGLPEELFGGGHEGAGEEDGGGDLVEAFEGPVVDGDLVDLEEELGGGGDRSQHLRHRRRSLELSFTFAIEMATNHREVT